MKSYYYSKIILVMSLFLMIYNIIHYLKPHQKHSTSEKHYLLFGAVRVCFFDLEIETGGAPDGLPQPLGQEPSLPLTGIHVVLHRLPSAVMHCKPTKSDKVTIIIPGGIKSPHVSLRFFKVLKLLWPSLEISVINFFITRNNFFSNIFCSYTHYFHYVCFL